MPWKGRTDSARSDGSKGEDQCEQEQCEIKHDWDDTSDGGSKNKVQMTMISVTT